MMKHPFFSGILYAVLSVSVMGTANAQGPADGKYRMHRGGCWSNIESVCHISYRLYKGALPERRYDVVGMRLALETK